MSAPKYEMRSIDRLEGQYKILYPLLRVFSAYTQTWGSIAIVFIFFGLIAITVVVSMHKMDANVFEFIAYVFFLLPVIVVAALSLLDAIVGRIGALAGIFYSILFAAFLLNLPANIFVLSYFLISVKDLRVPPFSEVFQDFLYVSLAIALPVITLFNVYVIQLLLRAAIVAFQMRPMNRLILRTQYGGTTWFGKIWYRLHSVPPVFEFVGKRKVLPLIMLSGMSGLCLGYATLVLALGPTSLARSFEIASSRCLAPDIPRDLIWLGERCSMVLIVSIAGLPVVLAPIFLFLGNRLERLVRRWVRLSLIDLQRIDSRSPILFLRAFGDDQIPLAPAHATWLGWAIDFGRRIVNFDGMLLEEGTPLGPVVALGNPGDAYPPYGAARGYFENKDWQQAVADLASSAAAIVICVDNTPNIWWEVEHILVNRHLDKTLILIHPAHRLPSDNAALTTELLTKLNLDNAAATARSTFSSARHSHLPETVLGFFVNSAGTLEIATSSTFSRFAFLLLLRWFLRTKLGTKPVSLPRSL
jgi:hypothetical protein